MLEWMLPLNEILTDEITPIDCNLVPNGIDRDDINTRSVKRDSLSKLIDILGDHSAKAQGLGRVLTTGEKLYNSPTHMLYMLKDKDGRGGEGEAIGILRVGFKHLFLFDEDARLHETEILCVLDFFVAEEYRRKGYGKKLFDFMLRHMEAEPHQLAIDGPSGKMEKFLAKNYGMNRLLRQSNNFAVTPEFFRYTNDQHLKVGNAIVEASKVVQQRTVSPKPRTSSIATVIHGEGSQDPPG